MSADPRRSPPSALSKDCGEHPFVSIVVCTVGNRPTLEQCLDSLLDQNCSRSEILLILNGLFDEAFSQRVAPYPVRLLHEPRPGVSIARNRAVSEARGEILAFVDDDVVAHPQWLHELIRGFEDPKVACITGRVIPEGPSYAGGRHEEIFFGEAALTFWSLDPTPDGFQKALTGGVVGFGCNMALQKEFLENHTLFPEDLGAGAIIGAADENYMFFQVLKHGFRIGHTPQALVTHFFENDPEKQKARARQLYAATIAFRLKLLAEEKGYRWATFQNMVARSGRVLRASASEIKPTRPPQWLSTTDKLWSYLRGFGVYWQSRRSKKHP